MEPGLPTAMEVLESLGDISTSVPINGAPLD